MAAVGLKSGKTCGNPPPEALPRALRASNGSSRPVEEDCPPRLCRKDLKDPEAFHQRLVSWLLKQR